MRRRRAAEARQGLSIWSGLRNRFVAALAAKPFEDAGKKAKGGQGNKSDW